MEKNLSDQVLNFPADSNFISPQRRLLLSSLLPKIILKMRYNDDDWKDEEFLEALWGKLKLLQDQIASIDSDLYIDDIIAIVTNSFDPAAVTSWKDVELGLFELEAYSDSLKNGAINVIKGVETRPTQTLSSLFFKMIESNVVAMDHPSIQLHYIELVNRHCNLFNSNNSNILAKALETFVSPRRSAQP